MAPAMRRRYARVGYPLAALPNERRRAATEPVARVVSRRTHRPVSRIRSIIGGILLIITTIAFLRTVTAAIETGWNANDSGT
jgi:hypothetical protein